jgi:VWFA-related protein
MRTKFKLYFVVFCTCHFILSLTDFCLAQPLKPENAKLKDSGGLLKKNEAENPEAEGVIRVETDLIINEVLVLDKNGNPVKDLKISDFVIKEDGRPQEISTFLFGDSEKLPRSIVLIIDFSGSQLPYIKTSIEAAKVLVDKLNPQDRLAIVTDNVELLQDFTTDKNLLKDKLESLKTSALSGKLGRSRQYRALMAVLTEMFVENNSRPIIIFQTDGDELLELKDERSRELNAKEEETNFAFEDVLTTTEKMRVIIFPIIPGIRFFGIPENEKFERAKTDTINNEIAFAMLRNKTPNPKKIKLSDNYLKSRANLNNRQQSALNQIAQITGGLTYYLEQPEQADNVYSEILEEMKRRYLIGYYPTNQARNGKRRTVSIELPAHPEYTIWGRKTYFLEEK